MNAVFRALTTDATGLQYRWVMARASYSYSRGYGLTWWASMYGAVELFFTVKPA